MEKQCGNRVCFGNGQESMLRFKRVDWNFRRKADLKRSSANELLTLLRVGSSEPVSSSTACEIR